MASKELQGFSQSLGSLGGAVSTFAKVGLAAVATAGVALVGGLGASISKAMDFEAAMSAVAAVAGASDSQLQQLSDTALKLGQDTTLSGIGATDAARAMRELAAAGMSVEDIVGGGALGALRLASAGGIDVAQAAEIASMALANFGLSGDQATRVADLFAAASNASAISTTDLAETMKYVGPIAHSMGLSIEDVTATVAALGNQGIKGSQAGTSLRSMIVSLAKPSKEATKVMNGLGLSFFDGAGKMKDMAGISEELKTKMSGLSDKQRASALATLFGNEALTAATVLYGEGADGINKWLNEVTTGATAAEVGAKRNDNLKGSIEALKSSFETAQIVLGKAFLPALKGIVDQMALGVSAAIPLIEAWGPRLVSGIQSAIGVIISFGGYVASAIGAIVGAFKALESGQITMGQFIGGVKTLITTVIGDIGGLLGGVVAFLSPYFSAIGSAITAALPVVAAELGKLASAFGGWIQGSAIPYLQANLPAWLNALAGWISGTAAPAVASAITSVANAFSGWITGSAIPYLQANLPLWIDAITGWITSTALPAITSAVTGLAAALVSWIRGEDVATQFTGWQGAVVQALANVVGLLGEFVAIAGPKLVEWIKSEQTQAQFGTLLVAVGSGTADILNALNDFSANAGVRAHEWLANQGPLWLHDWGELANVTGQGIVTISGMLDAWEQEQVGKFTAWMGNMFSALGTGLSNMLAAINNWINTAGPAWLHSWDALGQAVTTALGQMVADAAAAMGRLGAAILDGLAGLIPQGGGIAGQIGAAIVAGLVNGIMAGASQVASAAAAIVTGALQAARNAIQSKSPSRKFMELGNDAIEGLIIGMDEKEAEAAKKAADIASSVAKAATDILGAIGAVAGFDFANNSPSGETLGWFRHLAESIIQTLADVATMLGTAALDNAKKVADATGQIGSAVKSTLEGFKALAEYDFTKGSPTGDAMGWFRHLMESIVLNFAQAAQLVGTEGMAQATAFAKVVADVVGSMKSSLELFGKLKDYKDIPEQMLKALFDAMEGALEQADALNNRAKALLQAALDYKGTMLAAAAAFAVGQSINVQSGGSTLTAPSGVGGGGDFTKNSGGGGNTYVYQQQGPVYGISDFEDFVVGTMEDAARKGRT